MEQAQLTIEEEEAQRLTDAAKQLIGRKRAQKRLIPFAQSIDSTYEPYPVHHYIAERLEDVESGRIRRLAIFVPPAIGKSRLSSEIFPAWVFGRNPNFEIIAASYDDDLSRGFGRNVRNIIKSPDYELVFPGVNVAADAHAMDAWGTNQEGEYKAQGVGGGLIGFHANIAIIDDPFKDYASASSLHQRNKVWDWYSGVLLNRLRSYRDGPGSVILIMQRWHDDDLGGRLEKISADADDAEEWEIVDIPSLAEEDDALGRQPGECLIPDGPNRRTVEELKTIQARHPSMFMAVHQQKPVPDEGDMFKSGELRRYTPGELPPYMALYGCSDIALSEGTGDYTVHAVFGVDNAGHIWMLDLWRKQVDINEGVEKCVELMLFHKPRKWFFEKVGLQKAFGPVLQKRKRELGAFTLLDEVSMAGLGSKDSPDRAGAFAGAVQMGYVHVPRGAEWLGPLEYELTRFPNSRYDDQVDALALIGIRLSTLRGFGAEPKITDNSIPEIVPESRTFDQYLDRATRKRRGLRMRPGAIVLPFPSGTVLDEDYN